MTSLGCLLEDRLVELGIGSIGDPSVFRKTVAGLRVSVVCKPVFCNRKQQLTDTIHIMTSEAKAALEGMNDRLRSHYFSEKKSTGSALMVFAKSRDLSLPIHQAAQAAGLCVVPSEMDPHHLLSRFKALIQQKVYHTITLHGVAIEAFGRGVMIVGPSGIGKTTAALKCVSRGYFWIADDRVVVKKNAPDVLTLSGHNKIRNLIYTEQTGIVTLDTLIERSRIRLKTGLCGVIDVVRDSLTGLQPGEDWMSILDTPVRRIRVGIAPGGYLSENLLQEAIMHLT